MNLPYKSYYVRHSYDQFYKIFIFNKEFALIRDTKNEFSTHNNDFWRFIKDKNINYHWFGEWNKDHLARDSNGDNNTFKITRKTYKSIMAHKRFNKSFEDKLV